MRYSPSTEQQRESREQGPSFSLFPELPGDELIDEDEQGSRARIAFSLAPDTILRMTLEQHFPRAASFSLLLLHITSFEHIQMPPDSPIVHKRRSCQTSASLLEQVIHIVRRTLRADDQILLDEQAAGAAFLFPQVDQIGITHIAGRISYNIHLLQAETVIPPLQYETEIDLGFASYPEPASSLDKLLAHAGQIQERVVFRPAVLPQVDHPQSSVIPVRKANALPRARKTRPGTAHAGFPFMQIPSRLPTRLQQLIPYTLALDLRCAPVGRDHNRLTVAMANPADTRAIGHLRAATGMAIFPVACEPSALEILLASGW